MVTVHHNVWRTLQPVIIKMYRASGSSSMDEFLNCTHDWSGEYHTDTRSIVLTFNDPIDEIWFRLKYIGGEYA